MTDFVRTAAVAAFAGLAAGCADMNTGDGSTDLLADGLGGWVETGGADWSFADGIVEADTGEGVGYLLTPGDYADFELTVEFYVSEEHNSGVFFRCEDRANVVDTTCYEANIFDERPDQSGRTGGIPNFLPPQVIVDAAGRWNTYVIRAEGDHITVTLNGVTTVDGTDATFSSGPIALQWGAGTVSFRNVRVTRL